MPLNLMKQKTFQTLKINGKFKYLPLLD